MNKIVFIGIILLTSGFTSPKLFFDQPHESGQRYCELRGTMYITNNPQNAHYRVYVHEEEGFEDFTVFLEDDPLYATEGGLWYITDQIAFAEYRLFIAETPQEADFSIFYSDIESLAGCQ